MDSTQLAGDVTTIDWLLAGDPAIRWQVMRDLQQRPASEWRREQARVATEGWGARLLSHRDSSGRWTARLYGKKWISTTYSMMLLRHFGLPADDPRAVASCRLFLEEGMWHDGGITVMVSQPRSETCVTGFVLGLLSWFEVADARRERLVTYLLREQMADGGWNCERYNGARHSSFHTTISVLEGLRDYAVARGPRSQETVAAEAGGRELLLTHGLYRSHHTGAVVDPKMLRFTFPPRWHYDVLRALDYFSVADAPRRQQLANAIEMVLSKRKNDGQWLLPAPHPGATWFQMERPGHPSRWNTLRALRVLRWWFAETDSRGKPSTPNRSSKPRRSRMASTGRGPD